MVSGLVFRGVAWIPKWFFFLILSGRELKSDDVVCSGSSWAQLGSPAKQSLQPSLHESTWTTCWEIEDFGKSSIPVKTGWDDYRPPYDWYERLKLGGLWPAAVHPIGVLAFLLDGHSILGYASPQRLQHHEKTKPTSPKDTFLTFNCYSKPKKTHQNQRSKPIQPTVSMFSMYPKAAFVASVTQSQAGTCPEAKGWKRSKRLASAWAAWAFRLGGLVFWRLPKRAVTLPSPIESMASPRLKVTVLCC